MLTDAIAETPRPRSRLELRLTDAAISGCVALCHSLSLCEPLLPVSRLSTGAKAESVRNEGACVCQPFKEIGSPKTPCFQSYLAPSTYLLAEGQ